MNTSIPYALVPRLTVNSTPHTSDTSRSTAAGPGRLSLAPRLVDGYRGRGQACGGVMRPSLSNAGMTLCDDSPTPVQNPKLVDTSPVGDHQLPPQVIDKSCRLKRTEPAVAGRTGRDVTPLLQRSEAPSPHVAPFGRASVRGRLLGQPPGAWRAKTPYLVDHSPVGPGAGSYDGTNGRRGRCSAEPVGQVLALTLVAAVRPATARMSFPRQAEAGEGRPARATSVEPGPHRRNPLQRGLMIRRAGWFGRSCGMRRASRGRCTCAEENVNTSTAPFGTQQSGSGRERRG